MFNDDRKAAGGPRPFIGKIAAGVADDLLHVARALAKRAVRAHRRRVALRELEGLDDRMLKDIGLTRGLLPYEIDRMLIEMDEREPSSMWAPRVDLSADGINAAACEEEPFRRAA